MDAKALGIIQSVEFVTILYGECWFKGKVKCHSCDKFGHIMRDCHQPKKANYVNQVQDFAMIFYTCHKAPIQKDYGVWYLECGCSNHMTI